MLLRVRGEEHLLRRQYFPRGNCIDTAICTYSLPLLAALSLRGPPTTSIPIRGPDMSQRTVGMPEFNELIDMARLLVNLWEAAKGCLKYQSGGKHSDRSAASKGGWRHWLRAL